MKLVKFLQDYRGHLTGEAFYSMGSQAELSPEAVKELESRGIVEVLVVKTVKRPPSKKKSGK